MLDVLIEKPANHALIGGVVLLGLGLEEVSLSSLVQRGPLHRWLSPLVVLADVPQVVS
jgi:hypothetical protein